MIKIVATRYQMSDCLSALHSWFCHNGLTQNRSKSESILIGTRQRLCTFTPVASPTIAGIPIPFSETIKTLGVTLDQNLTLNKHISSLSRSIHFYTRSLRHIRPALSESMATSLGASSMQSRLDCTNSVMYGMSASNMHKLQSAQNSLTRVVLPSLRHLSASERLSYLHWLTVHYKYSSKSPHSPIRPWQPVSHLISTISSNYTSHHELSVLQPSIYSKYHICLHILVGRRRAFSYSSPATWNSIPTSVKNFVPM